MINIFYHSSIHAVLRVQLSRLLPPPLPLLPPLPPLPPPRRLQLSLSLSFLVLTHDCYF